MRHLSRTLTSLLLFALFALPLVITGCAEHRGYGYRYYDPYYNDYHYWNPDERVYYHRYYTDNHRQYRELRKLNRDEQKAYWHWRHEQAEHREHERDHDRH